MLSVPPGALAAPARHGAARAAVLAGGAAASGWCRLCSKGAAA